MRTTLNLPDALVDAAKRRAAAEGGTLTSFIEAALRQRLDDRAAAAPRPMPTFGRGGRGLVVDILDREALNEILDEPSDR
jgi:hypothetical protein